MHRRAISASAAALLLIGCGGPNSVGDRSPNSPVSDTPHAHKPLVPVASDGQPAPEQEVATGRDDGLVELSRPPLVGAPAESAPPDQNPAEFHPGDVSAEPFFPTPPPLDAEPTSVAAFVAETWASTGDPEFGWPGAVKPFLVPEFVAGAIPIEPALGRGTVRIAQAVAIDATKTPFGQRAIVTLEALTTIDDEARWR